MSDWKAAELLTVDGVVMLTVFDGEEIISIELMETNEELNLAESCAVALGFGVALEAV